LQQKIEKGRDESEDLVLTKRTGQGKRNKRGDHHANKTKNYQAGRGAGLFQNIPEYKQALRFGGKA